VAITSAGVKSTCSRLLVLLAAGVMLVPLSAMAKKDPADPALAPEQYKQLERAKSMARSKSGGAKANQLIISLIDSAQDVDQCLAIASYTNAAGFSLIEARTKSLQRAVVLSKNSDDLMRVVLKARQLQCFDVTSQAIKALLAKANTTDELNEVARKSQEIALNDVAHLALEKEFAQVKAVPDAVNIAKEARTLGMDDLTRKILKDLEDDCRTTAELMALLPQVEPFNYADVNRYCLHRALDYANNVDDYFAVFKQAQRLRQQDIFELAGFRGKKILLMQKLQEEQAATSAAAQSAAAQQELQQAEQRARDDLNKSAAPVNIGPGF
jgi:hypothetical protein